MQMLRALALVVPGVVLLLGSCSSGQTCVPGQSVACVGAGGCSGGQACAADGKGFGACVCGQAGADAGAQAGADAAAVGAPDAAEPELCGPCMTRSCSTEAQGCNGDSACESFDQCRQTSSFAACGANSGDSAALRAFATCMQTNCAAGCIPIP